MKTFVFDNNYCRSAHDGIKSDDRIQSWYFLADSALTNAGKPFFIPDFAPSFEAVPTIAVRINRLGKSIAPKFGTRYYSEYAPVIHFRAPELERSLLAANLSPDRARSFDRSLIMAEFMPLEAGKEVRICMNRNGVESAFFSTSMMHASIDETLSLASRDNTMKMGDIIIPALPQGAGVEIGDLLELTVDGGIVLSVQIK